MKSPGCVKKSAACAAAIVVRDREHAASVAPAGLHRGMAISVPAAAVQARVTEQVDRRREIVRAARAVAARMVAVPARETVQVRGMALVPVLATALVRRAMATEAHPKVAA